MPVTIKAPRVSQMISPKSGNPVANQYTIRTCDGVFFQSYGSIIAFRDYATGKITLDESRWDYSRTTGKYRNAFLGENTADTRKKIKSGEYAIANLNSNRI
jgi:hypothetical protein